MILRTARARILAGAGLLTLLPLLSAIAGNAEKSAAGQAPSATAAVPSVHIAEILREPESFRDKQVSLRGAFRGRKGACKWSAMLSQSDWVLDDSTGCIYVNGQVPTGLSSQRPAGEPVTVSGKVLIREGKPVLRGQTVESPRAIRK